MELFLIAKLDNDSSQSVNGLFFDGTDIISTIDGNICNYSTLDQIG